MSWFPLPLFPEGSLASSVVTTVWIGVLVFTVMNLRFGWVFSGLVVPGYLVPLLIVKPWAAAVVLFETVLTYFIVYLLTLSLPKLKLGCAFFGRDRFMAMIMISALLRLLFDTWLLPLFAQYLDATYGLDFDYRNNLHSFGLIVICLAANQLWKTGLVRGLFPFAFNLCVTYLLVRYVLMTCTNFSISNLSFMYEDIAVSMYAAPKAYIVLITTALLASRMNLLYGWDFNGIMIPALIALQWYEPLKVLTSFGEALAILGIAQLALRTPLFRSMTMEGARKMLLFFSISYLYKLLVGFGLPWIEPDLKVSDYYGFGYLLPTLIAIKMHDKHKVLHQIRITLQISLFSVVVANLVGFGLTLLPRWSGSGDPVSPATASASRNLETDVATHVFDLYIASHAALFEARPEHPDAQERYLFEQGLRAIDRFVETGEAEAHAGAKHHFAAVGYTVDLVGAHYLVLRPEQPTDQRPFFVFNRTATQSLDVLVPEAYDETGSLEAAFELFETAGARSLAVGGARSDATTDYGLPQSLLEVFHQHVGTQGSVEIRLGSETRLEIKRRIPAGLDLVQLEEQVGPYQAAWFLSQASRMADQTHRPFAVLQLSPAALVHTVDPAAPELPGQSIDAWLRDGFLPPAPRASGLYRAPDAATLLYMDRQLLRPLLELQPAALPDALSSLRERATRLGFDVRWLRIDAQDYVVLTEPLEAQNYWGGLCLRIHPAPPTGNETCFQIPSRDRQEALLSFAAGEFAQQRARMLLIAGSNSLTNPDGSANLTRTENRYSFFNLAHQAFVRNSPAPVVIQLRAFLPAPGEPWPDAELVIAPYLNELNREQWTESMDPIIQTWQARGIHCRTVGDADETSPYAVGFNLQARFPGGVQSIRFGIAWLSPMLRDTYQRFDRETPILRVLRALDIPVSEHPLTRHLENQLVPLPAENQDALKQAVRTLRTTGDPSAILAFPQLRFEGVLDPGSAQVYLVCRNADGQLLLVGNLAERAFETDAPPVDLEAFIHQRAAWWEGVAE